MLWLETLKSRSIHVEDNWPRAFYGKKRGVPSPERYYVGDIYIDDLVNNSLLFDEVLKTCEPLVCGKRKASKKRLIVFLIICVDRSITIRRQYDKLQVEDGEDETIPRYNASSLYSARSGHH